MMLHLAMPFASLAVTAAAGSLGCDCSWTHGGSTCGADDGSVCWAVCCGGACDCSWTHGGSSCGSSDGSVCWRECCGGHDPSPSPSPVPPTPGPSPSPPGHDDYCPSAADLTTAYGTPELKDQGWTVHGNGGVATKSTFNLLGGSVDFDIDLSAVSTGVNANIYTISPSIGSSGYNGGNYCDGADNDKPWCLEVDWLESNGNCGGATTLHTKAGPGPNGCTSWGCRTNYHYNGRSVFHMRIEYGTDGSWTTKRDGQVINAGTMSPHPGAGDWAVIKSTYESKGALIYSSEWQGWVPVQECGTSGNLPGSHFSIKHLRITGSVVQGPTPRGCSQLNSTIVV